MKKIIFLLLIMLNLHASDNTTIANEWEASPQYKEYLQFMEAGDLKSAMKIKKDKVDAITLRVMKPYLSYFKEKYREKYAQKICDNLPINLKDTLNIGFFKANDILKLEDKKEKNQLAQSFYNFFNVYYQEDGRALKYANKITEKFPKLKNKEFMNVLEAMAKESDTEAAKTPEQKQKEHDEYMKKLDKKIEEENKKQEEENKKQAEWDEIIRKLKIIGGAIK